MTISQDGTNDAPLQLPDELLVALDAILAAPAESRREQLAALCQAWPGFADGLRGRFFLASATRTAVRAAPPERIGPYRLIEILGEGGMGTVWLAEQAEPVQRRVALKICKDRFASDRARSRFAVERQALALMQHEHIARVFDAGTTDDDQPWFAMEHVPGPTLTAWCDRERLDTHARVELFAQVCAGVQHAHWKGVIHRDLKPSNILVDDQQHRAVPKIIDFGIGKLLQQPAEAVTLTMAGTVVGTPEYMAPEQFDAARDVDTRADVWALGVILYELLTGELPFAPSRLRDHGLAEAQRIIRDEEPPRPSTRITTIGEAATTTATARSTTPPALRRTLTGDLDWIVMKALEKDRERRYPSPQAMAEDLDRWRHSLPVTAGPPSVRYRLRKFVVRHRGRLAAAAALLLAMIAGTITSVWFLFDARAAQAMAEQQATRAGNVADFLQRMLMYVRPDLARGLDTKLLERVVSHARAELDTRLADDTSTRAELLTTIGHVRVALSQFTAGEADLALAIELAGDDPANTAVAQRARHLLNEAKGRADMADALTAERSLLTDEIANHGSDHPRTHMARVRVANLLMTGGDHAGAAVLFHEVLAACPAEATERAAGRRVALAGLAIANGNLGDLAAAERFAREGLEIADATLPPDDPDRFDHMTALAGVLFQRGEAKAAERLWSEALAGQRRVFPENSYELLRSTAAMIQQLAHAHLRGLLPPPSPTLVTMARETLATCQRNFAAADHLLTLHARAALGSVLVGQPTAEADAVLRGNVDAVTARFPAGHPLGLQCSRDLALHLQRTARTAEAETVYRRLTSASTNDAATDRLALRAAHSLATLLLEQRRHVEAEALLRGTLAALRTAFGNDDDDVAATLDLLVRLALATGRTDTAVAHERELLERHRRVAGGEHPQYQATLSRLGDLMLKLGDLAGAEATLMESWTVHQRTAGDEHETTRAVADALARLFAARHAAEPDRGHDTAEAVWRQRAGR